jgi:hypothetical protein
MTTDRPISHINQVQLSRRWGLSPRTLEKWRWRGKGPRFLKLEGKVVYRLADVVAYEADHMRERTGEARVGS